LAQDDAADVDSVSLDCGRDVTAVVDALVNGAPLILADLKAGADGRSDPLLATALSVANTPREKSAGGLEYPSELESALRSEVVRSPCFRAFERAVQQGAEDVSGVGRAVAQIEMPLARTYDLTVEYLPGKFRRNFLFQLSLVFDIRDDQGRVVFAESHGEHYRRTCFWDIADEAGGACLDLQGRAVDALAEWRGVAHRGISELLAAAERGLFAWRQLLEAMSGVYYDRKYSTDLDLNARQVRNREQLSIPYLFVQTPSPRVNINGLLAGLRDRGLVEVADERPTLQNHYNVLFRSALDRSLRAAISAGEAAENARIMLLSDAQSEAFQNALLIVCAEQSRGFNRDDCLEPLHLIERLCQADSPEFATTRNRRGDSCVLASLAYGRSLTRLNDEDLVGVRDAEQRIQAAGYVRAPENARDAATIPCLNLESQEQSAHLVGVSDTYYRIDGETENDDGLYLMDAALEALIKQSECMAERLLERYREIVDL
jgi:hypothetical protein